MRLDQIDEWRNRKLEARNRFDQRRRDRVRGRLAGPLAVEYVAPPLQPDFARHRLARPVAHPGDLAVERIKREKRTALLGGREQGREKAILVGCAD